MVKSVSFSVKFFYKFLIYGSMHSPFYPQFWKIRYPSKISLFCWLAWEVKLLTFTNLFKKGCNIQNATNTCILCHRAFETMDKILYLFYDFSKQIWCFFQIFELHSSPLSISKIWTDWIPFLHSQNRILWDLSSRAIMWNIWLERNNSLFPFIVSPYFIMIKIANILLS